MTETLVSAVVVGIGISAALFGFTTGTTNGNEGNKLLVSESLSTAVIELSRQLEFSDPDGADVFGPEPGEVAFEDLDDVNDLDGQVFCPPLYADGSIHGTHASWMQEIRVHPLDPDTFARLAPPADTGVVGLEVTISNKGRKIGTYEWIAVRR